MTSEDITREVVDYLERIEVEGVYDVWREQLGSTNVVFLRFRATEHWDQTFVLLPTSYPQINPSR